MKAFNRPSQEKMIAQLASAYTNKQIIICSIDLDD